jgi:hypothetical protein
VKANLKMEFNFLPLFGVFDAGPWGHMSGFFWFLIDWWKVVSNDDVVCGLAYTELRLYLLSVVYDETPSRRLM